MATMNPQQRKKIVFAADETALDLFRRCQLPAFQLVFNTPTSGTSGLALARRVEAISFGECIEILCTNTHIPDFILDISFQFFELYQAGGVLIHVSTGNNMMLSLEQSRLDASATPLGFPLKENRLQSAIALSISNIISIITACRNSPSNEPTLIILECLSTLLVSMKGPNGQLYANGKLLNILFEEIHKLSSQKNVIIMWINSIPPRKMGLRDGASSDPLSMLWKKHVKKYFVNDISK